MEADHPSASDVQLCFSFDDGQPQSVSGSSSGANAAASRPTHCPRRPDCRSGHAVRLTLASGPMVEGILFLDEDGLFVDSKRSSDLRLRVGAVDFPAGDVESCVRLD